MQYIEPGFGNFYGQDTSFIDKYLPGVNNVLTATTPPPSLYQPIDPGQFLSQAQAEVAPYFTKDLDIAIRQIEQARKQREEAKQLEEKFQGQEETQGQDAEGREDRRR